MSRHCQHLCLITQDGERVGELPPRNGQAIRRGIRKRRDRQIKLLVIKEHVGHITHSIARIKELTEELERDFGLPNLDVTPRWRRPDLPFLGSAPLDFPDQSA
jgi:hypothetical protein